MLTESVRSKSEKTVKKIDFLKDYILRLTEEQLRFLDLRLKHRLTGDLADAVTFLSTNPDMDRYLASSKNYEEFYDAIDIVQKSIERESRRRYT